MLGGGLTWTGWGGLMGAGGALGPGTSVPGSGWWMRDCHVGAVLIVLGACAAGLTLCRPAGAEDADTGNRLRVEPLKALFQ